MESTITAHDESIVSEHNSEFSDLTGLSKVLRADDSIADRVRCLLEGDEDSEPDEKPELLSSVNRDNPSNGNLKSEIVSLLHDDRASETHKTPSTEESISTKNEEIETNEVVGLQEENEGEVDEEPIVLASTTTGRRSGDGADFVPTPTPVNQDSADDIMNISDTTEYSDLPKVVDNPMKQSQTELGSVSQPVAAEEKKMEVEMLAGLREKTPSRIEGKAKFHSVSDPSVPKLLENTKQVDELENYVMRKDQISILREMGGQLPREPVHSTPYPSKVDNFDPGKSLSLNGASKRQSQEGNITMRNRPTSSSVCSTHVTSSPTRSSKSQQCITGNLEDEELLAQVRRVVTEDEAKLSGLKGPHTASENSIASTVDSLALQVKTLLKEEKYPQKMSIPDSFHDVSQNSNYSEEINNFEKTSLWKYTRQFLPGAMTPSRDIQPLAKFCDPSPQCAKEMLGSSVTSNCSSPETYRLARRSLSPRRDNQSGQNQPFRDNMSSHSQESKRNASSSTVRETSGNRSHAHVPSTSSTPHQSYSSRRDASAGNLPSRIIGRYDNFSNQTNFTPQNESYKPLEPEYSQTPFTPYVFVTPRKVTSERKLDHPVIKYESPVPRENASSDMRTSLSPESMIPRSSPKSHVQERSAYFSQRLERNIQKSPKVSERSPSVRFQRLMPDYTDTMRRRDIPQRDKFTSTKDNEMDASQDQIFVKPVTPPSRNRSGRQELGMEGRSNLTSTYPPQPVKSSEKVFPSSPKSVHFGQVSQQLPSQATSFQNRNLLRNQTCPSATPLASSRPPQRNITPKVEKEKPRPARSLPTYDQLVAEQEKYKDEESNRDQEFLPRTGPVSEKRQIKVLHNRTVEGDFSVSKPTVCLDETDEEESIQAPRRECDVSRTLSLSDTDLHRRTTHSEDGSVISDQTGSPVMEAPNNSVTALNGDIRSSCVSKGLTVQESASPPSSPADPAPLPYVRLCRKKPSMPLKAKVTPRHSISTEKVQNLLMKEKSVSGQQVRNQKGGTSASFPPSDGSAYTSTDEELVALLETFSTKVPLIEKLLRKLYDRNVEHRNIMWKAEEADVQDYGMKVSRSVQTKDRAFVKNPTVIRSKPKSLQCKSPLPRKVLVETSCQTSFAKAPKSPPFMTTIPVQEYFNGAESDSADEIKEASSVPINEMSTEDKENKHRKPKNPCAFFVDLTPEKLSNKPSHVTKPNQTPVAWFEPYEYMPPWKMKDTIPRNTLGFVDANIQDAFLNNKRNFVLKSWERQEDIAIRAEERKLKELEERIHGQIAALHKEKASAAAKSQKTEDISKIKKKNRVFGWKEMKIASKQKYEALPEVVAKKKEMERKECYELNRKRAELYKRKIARLAVEKQRGKLSSDLR